MVTVPETQAIKRKWGAVGAWFLLGLGVLYLANPGAGVIELIPDNLPLVGNLDEAGVTAIVMGALKYLRGKESE